MVSQTWKDPAKIALESTKQREKELSNENYQLRKVLFTLESTIRQSFNCLESGILLKENQVSYFFFTHLFLKKIDLISPTFFFSQNPISELEPSVLLMPFQSIQSSIDAAVKDLLAQIKKESVTFQESLIKSTCQEQTEKINSLEKQIGLNTFQNLNFIPN